VTTSIDRVHFYERQYLRAFDLDAEQLYHLQMRRRLNLALHLWGIVDGFDVTKGPLVPGAPDQFIISPGMAIDGFGREIVMPQAYALSSEDVRLNRIAGPKDCWLAIAYRRELATPPSPGYRLCDLNDQFTRWHETFAILILDTKPAPTPVGVADALSDDPRQDDWPVVIGKVHVTLGGEIDAAWLEDRVYVGSRTERLIAPMASLTPGTGEARRPIRILADALEEKNLAVGEDFPVDNTKVKPAPAAPIPTAAGNLKVGTDLFVRGEIYKFHSGRLEWLALKEHVGQLLPDIRFPASPNPRVVITAPNAANAAMSTGTHQVTITTRLLAPSSAELFVSLAGIRWLSKDNDALWIGGLGAAGSAGRTALIQASLKVLPNPVKTQLAAGTQYDFLVEWTVGPTVVPSSPPPPLPVVELHISCLGIFLP
jgi:hypothetical protein